MATGVNCTVAEAHLNITGLFDSPEELRTKANTIHVVFGRCPGRCSAAAAAVAAAVPALRLSLPAVHWTTTAAIAIVCLQLPDCQVRGVVVLHHTYLTRCPRRLQHQYPRSQPPPSSRRQPRAILVTRTPAHPHDTCTHSYAST